MLDAEEKDLIKKLTASVEAMRGELAENTRKTEEVLKGFPLGDPDGHRRYHEEVIQQIADRRKLWQELLTHAVKTSTWLALVGIISVLWSHFKASIMS